MGTRSTFLLFLLVLALGVYVYTMEIKKKQQEIIAEGMAKRVFPFQPADIERAGWLIPDDDDLVLEREDQGWKVTFPVMTPANGDEVEIALANLSEADRSRSILPGPADPGRLHEFDLEQPKLGVWIEGEGVLQDTILFGGGNPEGNAVYISRASTGEISLVESSLYSSLDKNLHDLRNRHPIRIETEFVNEFSLDRSGQPPIRCRMERDGDRWMAVSPIELEPGMMDVSSIRSFLTLLENMESTDVIDTPGDAAEYGLDEPELLITIITPDSIGGEEIILKLGSSGDDRLFASGPSIPPVFELDSSEIGRLSVNLTYFREKSLFDFERNDVDEILLNFDDETVRLEKLEKPAGGDEEEGFAYTTDSWQLTRPFEAEAEYYRVSRILSSILYLNVTDFILEEAMPEDLGRFGLDSPALKASLFANGTVLADVIVGAEVSGKKEIYITTGEKNRVLTAGTSLLSDLMKSADELKVDENEEQAGL